MYRHDSAAVLLVFTTAILVAMASVTPAAATVSAYAWPTSVAQGDSINIYCSTNAPWLKITIRGVGKDVVPYAVYDSIPGVLRSIPPSVWEQGCGWPVTLGVRIPRTWPSGVYEVLCSSTSLGYNYAIFTLREDEPGSTASILLQNSTTTWQAYNNWGGKCLYDSYSTDNHRAYIVSFLRPYAGFGGRGHYPAWELQTVKWLEQNGYAVEYCTDLDTHADPALQSHYRLFISCGHDEYWSWEMRRTIEGRIAAGGNAAFFGGNTCWWQVRMTPDLTRMICYKDRNLDPLTGVADSLVTVNWFDDPVFRPENSMIGVSTRNAGYVNDLGWYRHDQGYGDYTVRRASDWVFAGTGLTNWQEFGWPDSIVGPETDGALYTASGGVLYATGTDGTPLNFVICATSIASDGHATMGHFTAPSGAEVWNAATMNWVTGLTGGDAAVVRITKNVLARLAPHAASVALPVPASPPPAVALTPNPVREGTRIYWSGMRSDDPAVSIFDVTGRSVATLRDVSGKGGAGEVSWDGRDAAGNAVPSGIYFAVVEDAAGQLATTKLVVDR